MATFNNSSAYSIVYDQAGVHYLQGGHYFTTQFVDVGTSLPVSQQSLSSERSDVVSIIGGTIDGVTIGPNSTISAPISGPITGATITDGTIDGTPIGQATPAAGAFTTLNSNSANILGPLIAEGVSSSANAQAPSPTNSGITWGSSPTWAMQSFYDQSNTANNRAADLLFISGSIKFRFANDARNAFLDVFSINGGQASGVTGITSDSGTSSWTHTGVSFYTLVNTGNGIRLSGSASGGTPTITTDGANANITLLITTKGTGGITLDRATTVNGVVSASGAINTSTGLTVKEGANAKQGVATLVAGTVTVSNTSVTANSRILLTVQSLGTVTAPKAIAVTARTAGTSFVITSADNTDTSVVAYEIFEPGA